MRKQKFIFRNKMSVVLIFVSNKLVYFSLSVIKNRFKKKNIRIAVIYF